jgi:hypothetical protein
MRSFPAHIQRYGSEKCESYVSRVFQDLMENRATQYYLRWAVVGMDSHSSRL